MEWRSRPLLSLKHLDPAFALAVAPLIYGLLTVVPFYPRNVIIVASAVLTALSLRRGILALGIASLLSTFSIFYQFGGLG
ncbi:MAG: hypothetical protein DRO05_07010, partial [Thermoproteota archaeon]